MCLYIELSPSISFWTYGHAFDTLFIRKGMLIQSELIHQLVLHSPVRQAYSVGCLLHARRALHILGTFTSHAMHYRKIWASEGGQHFIDFCESEDLFTCKTALVHLESAPGLRGSL